MLQKKKLGSLIAVLLFFVGSFSVLGCGGDDEDAIYIKPFRIDVFSLVEGSNVEIKVILNRKATQTTYVDIETPDDLSQTFISLDDEFLRFLPEEDTKTTRISTLKATNNNYFRVVFKLRDSDSSQTIRVRVEPNSTT